MSHVCACVFVFVCAAALLTRNLRCLVVANSSQPFDAKVDRKDLLKFFGPDSCGKMLFCPCPNYATRVMLWRNFIINTGINYNTLEKNPKFDVNSLAYISEGYSAGNVQANSNISSREQASERHAKKGQTTGSE